METKPPSPPFIIQEVGSPSQLHFQELNSEFGTFEQILCASLLCLLTIFCLLITSSFVVLLLKQRREFQFPIYSVIMHLSISYFLVAVSQLLINIPYYIFDWKTTDTTIGQITYFIDQFADFGAIFFNVILAVNRLAILSIEPLKMLFQGKTKNLMIATGWALALASASFIIYYGCRKTYDPMKQIFFDDCYQPSMIMTTAYQFLFYLYYALPVISFLIYIFIGLSLLSKRKESISSARRVEIDLLIQSAITLLLYMVVMGISFLQKELTNSSSLVYISDILMNGLEVLAGIVFVLIFAIGNKTVRKAARSLCSSRRKSMTVTKTPIIVRSQSVTINVVSYSNSNSK